MHPTMTPFLFPGSPIPGCMPHACAFTLLRDPHSLRSLLRRRMLVDWATAEGKNGAVLVSCSDAKLVSAAASHLRSQVLAHTRFCSHFCLSQLALKVVQTPKSTNGKLSLSCEEVTSVAQHLASTSRLVEHLIMSPRPSCCASIPRQNPTLSVSLITLEAGRNARPVA